MGPWGGIGGQACRIMVEPVCLNSITIRSGKTLLAIAFSYSDKHGKPHHAGPWGANGGQLIGSSFHTILLGPSEHLIQISGTVDMNIEHSTDVITSITFTTNMSVYGPFGTREGLPFRSKLVSNGSIVGFFVRAMCLIDAIGIYVKPEREPMEKQGLITKTGPWGGYNGYLYDVDVSPRRLVSVVVRCSEIVLGRSEYLKEISGTVGPSPHPDIVMSLLFVTNIGSYGPFGGGGGTTFCSPELKNGSIIGFFAHAGQNVDAIGVYVDAIKEKESTHFGYEPKDNPMLAVNELGEYKHCTNPARRSGWRRSTPRKKSPLRSLAHAEMAALANDAHRHADCVGAVARAYGSSWQA
uniref:Jacalin-type lectin domain-containing protein n=1 Tax=Triticum aestivum TaxID=4565 RepID=A0A077S3X1_WHEAT|nr:unnamed protein product [Triticum aestivum]